MQLTNGKLATVWEAGWRRVGADRTRAVAEQVVESQLREHSTQFRIREV